MAKDPAFLFYSKDWIEGTAELLPEEKGVYIDLLCHQHQKGSLPTDTRRLAKLVGLGEQEFLTIWNGLKNKFYQQDDRLYNRKLTEVVTERLEKGEKNKIIGTLAAVFRLSKKPYELKVKAKVGFDYRTFLGFTDHFLTESVTEWFNSRLKSIENGNEDGNEDDSSNKGNNPTSSEGTKEGGSGETKSSASQSDPIVPKMQAMWYETIPSYTIDYNQDFPAIVDIYKFIADQAKLKDITNQQTQEKVLGTLQMIALEVNEDDFWRVKSLRSVAKNIQEFYNRIKERKNGKLPPKAARNGHHQPRPSNDEIKASLSKSFTQRGQV